MKKYIFVLLVCCFMVSCTTMERSFTINETENMAAWTRANVAIYELGNYDFRKANDYIIQSAQNDYYLTRKKMDGQWIYSICLWDFDYYRKLAESLEYTIRNIKRPEPKIETEKADVKQKVNIEKIEAQKKTQPVRKVLPNGTVVWE